MSRAVASNQNVMTTEMRHDMWLFPLNCWEPECHVRIFLCSLSSSTSVQGHIRNIDLHNKLLHWIKQAKQTPWSESAIELYRPSDRRLSAKLVPTFADRGCHVISVMDPHSRILWFLDRSRYFFFQVVPQLNSRGWVDPVPDPLPLRKSGSTGNRSRASGSVARNSDH
jgi:hypothetical protein